MILESYEKREDLFSSVGMEEKSKEGSDVVKSEKDKKFGLGFF